MLDIKGDNVNPEVLNEERGDEIALCLHVWLKLPLIVVNGGSITRIRCCVLLSNLPSGLGHWWCGCDAPIVIFLFKDAEIIVFDTDFNIVTLSAFLVCDIGSLSEDCGSCKGASKSKLIHLLS